MSNKRLKAHATLLSMIAAVGTSSLKDRHHAEFIREMAASEFSHEHCGELAQCMQAKIDEIGTAHAPGSIADSVHENLRAARDSLFEQATGETVNAPTRTMSDAEHHGPMPRAAGMDRQGDPNTRRAPDVQPPMRADNANLPHVGGGQHAYF